MKTFLPSLTMFFLAGGLVAPILGQTDKHTLLQSIDKQADSTWEMAQKIWNWAEPGYQEYQSARLLADALEKAGFEVIHGVSEIPTAFTATAGSRQPVIGILGEFDAIPGLSQQATPVRQPRDDTNWGHACGHHLFGAGAVSAAIGLGKQINNGKLHGTVRFYGCPAEEGGAAKVFMVRAGLFSDCDVVLHWHPSSRNKAGDRSCLARVAVKFRFHGKSAHASGAPEQGRSALDAVELTNHAAQLLREHTPESTRIHHVITAGGDAPNVVPNFCEVYYYIRHPDADVVRALYPRLVQCAQAGALATETQLEIVHLGGTMALLPNTTLSQVAKANLTALMDLQYSKAEQLFAFRIQNSLDKPKPLDAITAVEDTKGEIGKGSTDVGDVSWVVPTTGFRTACWVPGTPAHSWQAVAAGGMSIGRQGMHLAARVLAATAWDLYHQPETITAAKQEFRQRLADRPYQPLLEANQAPPLDYRNSPKRQVGRN